jgi:flagellin
LEKKYKRPTVSAKQEENIMALTLGSSNAISYRNSLYLNDAKSRMDKSLLRISSGRKILSGADDPGGLALSMRLTNELSLTNTIQNSVENAKSFTELQDGALKSAGDIIMEMSSLKSKYTNASDSDKLIYAGQFRELQVQLNGLGSEQLNGVSLFSSDASHKSASTIYTSAQGASGSSVTLTNLDYSSAVSIQSGDPNRNLAATSAGTVLNDGTTQALGTGVAMSISQVTADELNTGLEQIASLRAQAGGKASTLGFASEYLATKSAGLEAANSRVMDADIAAESINYSKYSMQYQAAAAALAQSNLTTEVVMDLLLSINKK